MQPTVEPRCQDRGVRPLGSLMGYYPRPQFAASLRRPTLARLAGAIGIAIVMVSALSLVPGLGAVLLPDDRLPVTAALAATPEVSSPSGATGGERSACTVEPIGLPEVERMLAELPPSVNATDDVASVDELPMGSPASPESVDAVVTLEQEFMACLNRRDLPRLMALLTGSALRTLVEGTGLSAAELYRATPVPTSAGEEKTGRSGVMEVTAVREVRVLDDGRIGAIVVWDDPASPGTWTETLFHIYERVDGRLLMDEEIVVTLP